MLKQTSEFLGKAQSSKHEYTDSIFNEVRKIYKVDGCDIVVSNAKRDVKSSTTPLIGIYGNSGILEMISNFRQVVDHNIPVKTYTEYLKEIKDCIVNSDDGVIDIRSLDRFIVPVAANIICTNIIVVGKEGTKNPIIINELFVNDMYVKTVEYDLEDMRKEYEALQKPMNIMDEYKHTRGVIESVRPYGN